MQFYQIVLVLVNYFYQNQITTMNVESLKTELQQVLDNDVALRKEFNELKRSLSDYRNQLIMRDEDCKRLQVTIDILNTKLVVMERDNVDLEVRYRERSVADLLAMTVDEVLAEAYQLLSARLRTASDDGDAKTPLARLQAFLNAGFTDAFLTPAHIRTRIDLWSAAAAHRRRPDIRRAAPASRTRCAGLGDDRVLDPGHRLDPH